MRLTWLLACIATTTIFAQSYDTYGKTEAEILKMSATDWENFYTSKAGDSTVSECDGVAIYGVALQHRNNGMMNLAGNASAKLPVARMRSTMSSLAGHCIDLSENMSGGGTIWSIFYANIRVDVETVVYAQLGGSAKNSKHFVVSDLKAHLAEVESAVKKEHADKDAGPYFKYPDALASLAQIRQDAAKVLAVAKGLKRADSDRVLGLCIEYADIASKGLAAPG